MTVRSTIALGLAALAALVMSVGCACNLESTPMVILQPTEPGAGRVVGLHRIALDDEPTNPSRLLGYEIDAIPPAIVELIEQAHAERIDLSDPYANELMAVRFWGLILHDWGGRVAALRLRSSSEVTDDEYFSRDRLSEVPAEYVIWIERDGVTEPPFWLRTCFQMPENRARLAGVQHGYALITIASSRTVDAVFDLNTDPPTRLTMPEHARLYAVSFRPDGSWAGLSSDTVFFGTKRDGVMQIERTIAITPPDDRRYTGVVSEFPYNADIHLSEDGQRALLHDFRIVARDGTITEAPEAATAFRVIGTPSRAGIVAARIGFVNPIPANFRRSSSELVRIDLNTLEYSIFRMRGQPNGSLHDVAPGFAAAVMDDRWYSCDFKTGLGVHTLHSFNERGRFGHRRSALTSGWPASGWYEEPALQPNN